MYKKEKWCSLLLWTLMVISAGCKHKPAYSDIDANRTARNQNQNSEAQPAATSPNPGESPAPASQPAPATPAAPFKQPSFVDPIKNEIRDLPSYPRAIRISVQIGPMQGVNVMSLGLRTLDTMDKITAFYEKAIKDNKWTVIDKSISPELSEWNLSKGEDNSAKVQVKKTLDSRATGIVIVRGEKIKEAGK